MGNAFVRETQIVTSERRDKRKKEIELCVQTEGRKKYYGSHRSRAHRFLTSPKQASLNDKHAWIYLERLITMNFGEEDYHLTLTYKHLPATVEDAKRDYDRFVARAKKLYKSHGKRFEAVMVMSQRTKKSGEMVRLHIHVIMRGGIDRTEIEALWRAPDRGGRYRVGEETKRHGVHLGYANCKRLQLDEDGVAPLCAYLKKQPREGIARRWYATLGLKKPYISAQSDDKYSIDELRSIAERNADAVDVSFWERHYPGWTVCEPHEYAYSCTDSEFSGLSIRIKLRRLTERELAEKKREKSARGRRKERAIE